MVIRTRLRSILFPLALYLVSGSVTSYFVWHAIHGERGLRAKDIFREKIAALDLELVQAQAERKGWEQRVAMMRAEAVDRDLLDEETRSVLGRASKNDLVVFLPRTATP